MKKSFTLIELLFTIVIIGLLAAVAIPNFKNLTSHAKDSSVKSVISSVQSAIDEIHGRWVVDDNYNWEHPLTSNGYPQSLDDGAGSSELFSYVLKTPIPACSSKKTGCWVESDDLVYDYYYNPSKYLRVEYNNTTGTLQCEDSPEITKEECEKIIY